jgi:hypothetical protein
MSKHTDGPWLVAIVRDKHDTTSYQVLTHTHTLVSVNAEEFYEDGNYPERDDDGFYIPDEYIDCSASKVANAYLIAAAPDLLEALKALLKTVIHTDVAKLLEAKQAFKAIKKAEGKFK